MEEIKIIGYFVDVNGDKTKAENVFVAIDDIANSRGDLTVYCPIGQHSSASLDYIKECKEITKEEYLEASKIFYTPKEYL